MTRQCKPYKTYPKEFKLEALRLKEENETLKKAALFFTKELD